MVENPFDLAGRIALVSGGGSGLGFAIARGLANAGARVAINGRNFDKLEIAKAALAEEGINAHAYAFDVSDEEGVAAGLSALERDLGDGQVRVAQQRRGPLDSTREQVPVRRDAESVLERSREVGLGHAAHARQPPDGPLLVRRGVHPVLRAQQAAQQLGILACMVQRTHAITCIT